MQDFLIYIYIHTHTQKMDLGCVQDFLIYIYIHTHTEDGSWMFAGLECKITL